MAKFVSFKGLNDRTAGFRYRILNQKGLVRRRAFKSKPFSITAGPCMTRIDMGKTSVYLENKWPARILYNFAG
jgi:hypothetical protein